jgi:hypothetical protein
MADFFAIITNFGTAPRVNAHLEVSANTDAAPAGADVLYTVFQDGNQLAEFSVKTNEKGFASNATAVPPNKNLFKVSNGNPALVRARTPSGATTATAILSQRGQDNNLIIGIPPSTKAVGKVFPIAVGTVSAAALLVGNVSGGEVVVDVFIGTTGAPGAGKHSIQIRDNQIGRIDLGPEDQNAHLIVSASGNVVVQLMLDIGAAGGRVDGVTCVPI